MKSLKQSLLKGFNHIRTTTWPKWRPWVANSGASVTFIVNPWNWRLKPWAENAATADTWPAGPRYKGVVFGWLFLIVKVWIDNDDY